MYAYLRLFLLFLHFPAVLYCLDRLAAGSLCCSVYLARNAAGLYTLTCTASGAVTGIRRLRSRCFQLYMSKNVLKTAGSAPADDFRWFFRLLKPRLSLARNISGGHRPGVPPLATPLVLACTHLTLQAMLLLSTRY